MNWGLTTRFLQVWTPINFLLLATGVMGAWTLLFLWRSLRRRFGALFSVSVFFSPKGGCTDAVVDVINKARNEVLCVGDSLTFKDISQALVEAKKRNLHIDTGLHR